MLAEVIAIGDELTSGQRLDTNSQWLSLKLGEMGIEVRYHSTCGDDLASCSQVFRTALERADIIVATGGLGPTADDLTRQAIANAAEVELKLDETSLEHIRSLFAGRGRTMPEQNSIQAMFPQGSQVIPNPHGTAPGIDLTFDRTETSPSRLFALPGVPAEMKEMWEETVLPRLQNTPGISRRIICHHRVKCFGVGESDLESRLPDLIRRGRSPSVGITVHKATITLRVTSAGETLEECQKAMEPTINTIHECLGDLVFGQEDDELENAVASLLQRDNKTLSVCETGTAGTILNWFGDLQPACAEFLGGVTVHSTAAMNRLLDTKLAPSQMHEALAKSLAERIRLQFSADIGLALSPFPRPGVGDGNFSVAVASASETVSKSFLYAGHPDILKHRAAKQALNFLRLQLVIG